MDHPLRVTLPSGGYDIVAPDGDVLDKLASDIANAPASGLPRWGSLVVISDEHVWFWHGFRLMSALSRYLGGSTPGDVVVLLLPPGEQAKTRASKEQLEDAMLAARCHRDTLVVAFGGGVVGDLAGYVASTYMRGVPVVQVPTTLLAMVDSAIGGKTGLDVPAGKNLVGAFHQPSRVYIDTAVLRTLSLRELRNGFAEVVKVAAIRDEPLFALLEDAVEVLLGQDAPAPASEAAVTASSSASASTAASAGTSATATPVVAVSATGSASASLPGAVALLPLRARPVACDAAAAPAASPDAAAGLFASLPAVSGVRFNVQLLSGAAAGTDPVARRPLGGPSVCLVSGGADASAPVASSSGASADGSFVFYVASDHATVTATAAAAAPLQARLSFRRFADEALLRRVIAAAAGLKAGIVSGDEREGGARALLNFGHTVGHGLEAVLAPRWLHGECVSVGMVVEAEAARALGVTSPAVAARLRRVLASFGLPVKVPGEISRSGAALASVFSFMAVDKKNARAGPGAGASAAAFAASSSSDPSLAHDPVQQAVARAAGIAIKCSLLRSIGSTLDVSPARDGSLPAEGAAPAAFIHAVPAQLLARLLAAAVSVHPDLPTQSSGLRALGVASAAARAAAGGALSAVATAAIAAGAVRIRTPGSKSLSNRALLLAGMAAGRTRITGLLDSDDTTVMLACLRALGAGVSVSPSGDEATVTGTGGRFRVPPPAAQPLYVGNAGTASRFLTALLCLLPYDAGADATASVELRGNSRMHERPIGPLVDALRSQGAAIEYGGKDGCPPLRFTAGIGSTVDTSSGGAGAGAAAAATPSPVRRIVRLAAKLSSQYVSALLMAAPYFPPLRSGSGSGGASAGGAGGAGAGAGVGDDHPDAAVDVILDEEHPTSLPYIIMTCRTMAQFGVAVQVLADNHFRVPRTPYRPPGTFSSTSAVAGAATEAEGHFAVEADASSASYPAAIAAVNGRCVVLEGVGSDSSQGDAAFPLHLRAMGCVVHQDETSTVVWAPGTPGAPADAIAASAATPAVVHGDGSYTLRGAGTVDMADTTDCFMTLAAVAAVAEGETTIVGIANQRVKECDRIAATAKELRKVGVQADELPDGLRITGLGLKLGKGPVTVSVASAPAADSATAADGDTAEAPVVVHCYDDHRIAMSFAVLSLALRTRRVPASTSSSSGSGAGSSGAGAAGDGPGCALVLDDAACTAKTYPEFWDDCEALHPHAWGMSVLGRAPLPSAHAESAPLSAGSSSTTVGAAVDEKESSAAPSTSGAGAGAAAHSAASCTANSAATGGAGAGSAGGGGSSPSARLQLWPQVILFTGMRGAGKSTLALRAAQVLREHLQRTIARAQAAARVAGRSDTSIVDAAAAANALVECVDADEETVRHYAAEAGISTIAGAGAGAAASASAVTVADIVRERGWDGFRRVEAEALKQLMSSAFYVDGDACPDAAAVVALAQEHNSRLTPCFRVIACGGGVVETEACRDALQLHEQTAASGGLVIEVRRSIDDIEASLAASSSHAGDAGRPAYAGGASLRETYARRAPWFASCSSHTFALAPGDTADWPAAAADFDCWFARLVGPRMRGLWSSYESTGLPGAVEGAGAGAGASAVVSASTSVSIGAAPWQQLDAHAEDVLGAAAAGKSVAAGHLLSSLHPPTHFVCLTCPSIWALLPAAQLREAAARACAATGVPLPGDDSDASPAQLAELCEAAPLHAMQSQSAGTAGTASSPLDLLGDVIYALTSGSGASGVELRADLLLQRTLGAMNARAEFAHIGGDTEPIIAALEAQLGYFLAVFRRAWRVGYLRRGLASARAGAAAALPRAAVHALPSSLAAPPLIFTLRSSCEGGALDISGRAGCNLYMMLCYRAIRLGVDCIDLQMGRPRPSAAEDASWRDSLATVYQLAAASGVTVIASAHWPGEAAPPSAAVLSQAVQRTDAIVADAAMQTHFLEQNEDGSPSPAAAQRLAFRALGAVKLIGSGPAAGVEDAASRASLRAWVSAMAAAEQQLARTSVGAARHRDGYAAVPLIGLCMGGGGRITRVLNQHLTPVTHPALAVAAAPGQLSAAEIMLQRRALGLLSNPFAADAAGAGVAVAASRRQLLLFGHPVAASPSPAMHGAAFAAAGMAADDSAPGGYEYGRCDTEKADACAAVLPGSTRAAAVVGGNVTIPLKQDVLPLCHALTAEAAAIGASNTLVALQSTHTACEAGGGAGAASSRLPSTVIAGANTDWLGIARPLSLRLQSQGHDSAVAHTSSAAKVGLVVGAGGTALAAAFALLSLGLTVVVHNPRTPARAQEVVDRLASPGRILAASSIADPAAFAAEVLASAGTAAGKRVVVAAIVSTLPAAAGWTAPEWLLAGTAAANAASSAGTDAPLLPVVFDVAYRPRRTALLEQARAAGCAVIEGAEMLVHQGAAAWATWTGRAPLRAQGHGPCSGSSVAFSAAPCLSTVAAGLSGSAGWAGDAAAVPAAADVAAAAAAAAAVMVGVPFAEMADAVYGALEAAE